MSRQDLQSHLEQGINKLSSELKGVKNLISKNTISKASPSFSTAVSGQTPSSPNHLATKQYVDVLSHNVIKNDGSSFLETNLAYRQSPKVFKDNDVITKAYANNLLGSALKTIRKYAGSLFPEAHAGDCFMLSSFQPVFAQDGPEVQKGDLLICIENSIGGSFSQVGDQFAIINTNVIHSTEEEPGILRLALQSEIDSFNSDTSAITPVKYKNFLDSSSMYNRIVYDRPSYDVLESDRGILAVDARRSAVIITLPSISSLEFPNLFKITIKDEFGQAMLRNITIKGLSSTIDGDSSIVLSNDYQAITIYNDGKNYYIESNTHSSSELSSSGLLVSAGSVNPSGTTLEVLKEFELDLRQFDINEGFKVEAYGFFANNSDTKSISIDLKDSANTHATVTNATTTAPQNDAFYAQLTVIKAPNKYESTGGFLLLEGIAADTYSSNLLNLDWNDKLNISFKGRGHTTSTDVRLDAFIITPIKQ